MSSRFRLRTIFAPLVKIIAKGLIAIKVTPNIATILMCICALMASLFLVIFQHFLLFGIFIFITGLMDGVDGAIARLTNQKSNFGGFFDSTMDRISEIIIFTGMLLKMPEISIYSMEWGYLIVSIGFISSNLISYTRARAELALGEIQEHSSKFNIGFMGRSERLFFLFIISLLAFFFQSFDLDLIIFNYGLIIFSSLTLLTFLFRFSQYRQYIINSDISSQ